jgi:hypothetical protein
MHFKPASRHTADKSAPTYPWEVAAMLSICSFSRLFGIFRRMVLNIEYLAAAFGMPKEITV